ncbi:MAG: oxidoreductase [Chloroflexi bacterium B3_Chlor]|nr:MAG: oxidoreductase [Chloroflexi bacterium B3_Chlor]
MAGKPKVAFYWAASCGGCEIAVLEIREKILDLVQAVDIVFWPVAMDIKYKDVEAMEDGGIDVCFFNGAIRNTENEHMARLLRAKSRTLVAYGSCAHEGCIPGLANLSDREAIFDVVYKDTASTENGDDLVPQTRHEFAEGEVELPVFYNSVKTLGQTVPVDYFVPGCPPQADQTWAVFEAFVKGELPAPGSVIGAGEKTVCDECERVKEEKKVKEFFRIHEIIPDEKKCLLEQGIVCAGPATRSGCGGLCPMVNLPCRGCYGPPPEVVDQGAKLLSAVASVVDADTEEEARQIVSQIVDPIGTFYRFGLAASLLRRRKMK